MKARRGAHVTRWLEEPFLHFLVGGAVLFAAYAWLNPTTPDPGPGMRPIRTPTR